jgi:hypothetical protein
MSKVRLGGIKAFARRAYLTSLCRSGDDALGDICSRLSAERININLLTHIADTGMQRSITAASTENAEGFSSYIQWKDSHGQCSVGKLLTDVSAVSIFPHDQKLDVIGSLISTLAGNGIRPYGLASSPSAMTMLIPSSEFEGIICGLFDTFEFPAYSSPLDWHAAYRGQEDLLNEIISAALICGKSRCLWRAWVIWVQSSWSSMSCCSRCPFWCRNLPWMREPCASPSVLPCLVVSW